MQRSFGIKKPHSDTSTLSYRQDIVIQFLFWGPVSKAQIRGYDEHNPELKHVLNSWAKKDEHTVWGNSLSARQGLGPQENWLLPSEQSPKCFYHSGQISDIIFTFLLFTSTASFAKQYMGTKRM